MEEPTVTQLEEQETGKVVTPPVTEGQGTGTQGAEEWFLEVDDRHRYRTKEDAIKAHQEASNRIGELTPYQERLKAYGLETPDDIDDIVAELLEYREGKRNAPPPKAAGDTKSKPSGSEGADGFTEQDVANQKYLAKLGFITQEKAEALQARIDQLEGISQSSREAETERSIELGRSHLQSLVTDTFSDFKDRKEDLGEITQNAENFITTWLENQSPRDDEGVVKKGTPLDRFLRGGEGARKIVEEGFQAWMKSINLFRNSKAAGYQAGKEKMRKAIPKPLPGSTSSPPAPSRVPGRTIMGTPPELHDKAWEIMQRYLETSEE